LWNANVTVAPAESEYCVHHVPFSDTKKTFETRMHTLPLSHTSHGRTNRNLFTPQIGGEWNSLFPDRR